MATKYIVTGGYKLNGEISVQYSKNIAMKLLMNPLLVEGEYLIKNIPRITSTFNLIKILEFFGCVCSWKSNHDVFVDSRNLNPNAVMSDETFSHTSSAILAVQILVGRFGKCVFEKKDLENIGGDRIGSRQFQITIDAVKNYGISVDIKNETIIFTRINQEGFEQIIPDESYGISVGALYSALFKESNSRITGITKQPDFKIILQNLKQMGVKYTLEENELIVEPFKPDTAKFELVNISDWHDFATLVFMGIITESSLRINNFNFEYMAGDVMVDYLTRLGVAFTCQGTSFLLHKNKLQSLRPIDIIASVTPSFMTEWQVLISALLTQINGYSHIAELWFTDRMSHWNELKKMGANFTYLPNRQSRQNKPFVVRVLGRSKLVGTTVTAENLRSGAVLIMAALVAEGKTDILGVEHIERGYDNLVQRLNNIGAHIEVRTI